MANGITPSQRITAARRNQKYPSGDFCNQRSNGLRFQTSMAISPKNKKVPGITRKQNVTMRRVSDRCRIASPPTPANAKSNPRRALFSRGELGTVTPHCTNSDAQNFKVPDNAIAVTAEVLLKGMSIEKSPLRLDADPFLSRHSAQLFERALLLREWSCSG
jgi:hypothetical protein